MALIECSECGKLVSDKAKYCPHCGCPSFLPVKTIPITIDAKYYKDVCLADYGSNTRIPLSPDNKGTIETNKRYTVRCHYKFRDSRKEIGYNLSYHTVYIDRDVQGLADFTPPYNCNGVNVSFSDKKSTSEDSDGATIYNYTRINAQIDFL